MIRQQLPCPWDFNARNFACFAINFIDWQSRISELVEPFVCLIITAVENVILVEVGANTALFREDLASLVLVEDPRATSERVDMPWLRHNFAYCGLRLKKDTARHGAHKQRPLYHIIVPWASLEIRDINWVQTLDRAWKIRKSPWKFTFIFSHR